MARRPQTRRAGARRSNADEEEDGRRYSSRNQAPNMAPVVGIIAIVAVCGLGFALVANQNKKPVGAQGSGVTTKQAVDPFADIPDETGPAARSPGGKSAGLTNRSPADLLDDPEWRAAAARANEGYLLHAAAKKAKRVKDNEIYLSKGLAARTLFDQLLQDTFTFEEDLLQKYGENDRRVKQIVTERSKWFTVLGSYRGLRND